MYPIILICTFSKSIEINGTSIGTMRERIFVFSKTFKYYYEHRTLDVEHGKLNNRYHLIDNNDW